MASIVVKASPDEDLYVYWSSITESPVFVGKRAEMLEYLALHERKPSDMPEVRVARADQCGTSALYPTRPPYDGAWEDSGFIVEQRGWLPRARLGEFARLYAADDAACYALLEPFEDEAVKTDG